MNLTDKVDMRMAIVCNEDEIQTWNVAMISLVFSRVALNCWSVTARLLARLTNLINWMAAFSSFFKALGFKLIYKQTHAKYCDIVWIFDLIIFIHLVLHSRSRTTKTGA